MVTPRVPKHSTALLVDLDEDLGPHALGIVYKMGIKMQQGEIPSAMDAQE